MLELDDLRIGQRVLVKCGDANFYPADVLDIQVKVRFVGQPRSGSWCPLERIRKPCAGRLWKAMDEGRWRDALLEVDPQTLVLPSRVESRKLQKNNICFSSEQKCVFSREPSDRGAGRVERTVVLVVSKL